MTVTIAPIRPILRVEDVCDLLRICRSQFYALQDEGFFAEQQLLVEIEPRMDRMPRYSGEPFVKWLSDKRQQRLFRERLLAMEKAIA